MRRAVLAVMLVLLGACGGGEASPPATVAADRCLPFPMEQAESHVTNSDTGVRNVEGAITKTRDDIGPAARRRR